MKSFSFFLYIDNFPTASVNIGYKNILFSKVAWFASRRPCTARRTHLCSEKHVRTRLGSEWVGSLHLQPLQLLRSLPEVLIGESIYFCWRREQGTRVGRCGNGLGKLRHDSACPPQGGPVWGAEMAHLALVSGNR